MDLEKHYFISDLHLSATEPAKLNFFFSFLQNQAMNAKSLYILGDLFAIWLGDDLIDDQLFVLQDMFHKLHHNNVSIYIMPGNRDFLLTQKFCQSFSCQLLPDPYCMQIGNKKILLTHGDSLCTFDYSYQIFRYIVQNSYIKSTFLKLPKKWRNYIGNTIKKITNSHATYKHQTDPTTCDVNTKVATKLLDKYQVELIIHGHTHRPMHHIEPQRWVLGSWDYWEKECKILLLQSTAHEDKLQLIDLST